MYSPALASWSGAISGVGTGAICSVQLGPLTDDGSIIQFTVTRVAAGDATLSFLETEPLGTTFVEAGDKFRNMEPPVIVDTSAILAVFSLVPTPTPAPTATPVPTVEPTVAAPPPPPPAEGPSRADEVDAQSGVERSPKGQLRNEGAPGTRGVGERRVAIGLWRHAALKL